MYLSTITGMTVATLLAMTPAAIAQSTTQTTTKTGASADVQTFTGCLMGESAYRSAHHLGAGALNGAGLGDEFVLVDVAVTPAKASTNAMSSSTSSAASSSASTSMCADKGVAYRVTGHDEEQLKGLVGHQLEVQGKFKHADDVTAAGTEEGSKLPAEVEMVSFREAPAPVSVSTPAPQPTAPVPPPPPPAPATMAPATPPLPPVAPAPATPTELPHTAGSSVLIALVGGLALAAALAMALRRRLA